MANIVTKAINAFKTEISDPLGRTIGVLPPKRKRKRRKTAKRKGVRRTARRGRRKTYTKRRIRTSRRR